MPEGTEVDRLFKKLVSEGKSEKDAARIAQARTGMALKTGKRIKKKSKMSLLKTRRR